MEQFDYIKVEAWVQHPGPAYSWNDLTPDLIWNPRPTGTRGKTSPNVTTRMADPGTFKFTLDNSASNSVGTLGYYSPDHPNSIAPNNALSGRGGWGPGTPIRVSFAYDTWQPYYKWYGWIDPLGVRVYSGTNGERRVEVTCSDFLRLATIGRMDLITSQSNKTPAQAMEALEAYIPDILALSSPGTSPLATEYRTGLDALETVFDGTGPHTTILSEYEKIVQSVSDTGTYIWVRGDLTGGETLVLGVRPQSIPVATADAGALLLENGDNLLLEDGVSNLLLDELAQPHFTDNDIMPGSQFSFGKHITNRVEIVSYPRTAGTVTTDVLWKLQTPTPLNPTETVTMRGQYSEQTSGNKIYGTDFQDPPVSGTDYVAKQNEDGSGATLTSSLSVSATFGSGEVSISVENTGGTALWFGGTAIPFQVRGRAVSFQEPARVIFTDSGSIQDYGERSVTIDRKYAQDPVTVNRISNPYITTWADPKPGIDKLVLLANRSPANMAAFLWAEPFTSCLVTESMTGISGETFTLTGYTFEIVDPYTVIWYPNFL